MGQPASPLSPAQTPLSSRRSSSARPKLSLDLSDLPPLTTPSPPTNTLLITNLDNLAIFQPANLQAIRNTINQHVAIHSFSPLRSFRRIIVSFFDIQAATLIKQRLDCEIIMDCRVRVYFGAQTDLGPPAARHLEAPKVDKLFFISPPPSPPHDWEVRNEEPPNKEVHAEDLAQALAKLHARNNADGDVDMDDSKGGTGGDSRLRSPSVTVVYHPGQHGNNPALPAISVEDTTTFTESPQSGSPMEDVVGAPILHTSRPPIELMEH